MAIDKIRIFSSEVSYYVEANLDESGFRFMQTYPEEEREDGWVGTIIDNDQNFVFASFQPQGLTMQIFEPTIPVTFRNGKTPPLDVGDQIEAETEHGKKMIARHLYGDQKSRGVIVGYSDGENLWSVALCTLPEGTRALTFSFAS